MTRAIRLDKDLLDKLGDVHFSWSDFQEIVAHCSMYVERFSAPASSQPFHIRDWEGTKRPEHVELEARRAFVQAIAETWADCRRKKGLGSAYNINDEIHTGPLNMLLQELFREIGGPTPPSATTLHHDLKFLSTGRERPR